MSILVPVYGVEKYIERCARSLFEQTYDNIEYIFVDDCTKDRSIEILQKVLKDYPNKKTQVKILHHEKNRGLSAARNTAVDLSTGKYLMHVDGDDFLELSAVAKLVEKAESECADIVIFGHKTLRKSSESISSPSYVDCRKVDYIKSMLLHSTPASIWNKFYNAKFYKGSGIRSIEGLNFGEDYAVVPRLIYVANKITILDYPLYNYEQSNVTSYTNNISVRSIYNLKRADDVLAIYFSEIKEREYFREVVKLIPLKSMLSLVKMANCEIIQTIYDIYKSSLNYECIRNLGFFDKVLFKLLVKKEYKLASILITMYWKLNK